MRKSAQRDTVLEVVLASSDHPTADTVYARCRERVPNISLGTVYRDLSALASEGLIRQVGVSGGKDRFDKTVVLHAHFRCKICDKVTDVEVGSLCKELSGKTQTENGDMIENTDVLFTGVCADCGRK